MKALLIICCSLLVSPAIAQQKKDTPPGTIPNVPLFKSDNYRLSPPNYFDRNNGVSLPYTYRINAVPPGIYSMPQDNMPCIVPNTFGMTQIPNAAPMKQLPYRSYIPNAAPFKSQGPWVVPQTK